MTAPQEFDPRVQIDRCCDAFDAAWLAAVDNGHAPPHPADFLLTLGKRDSEHLAYELRKIDIDYALRYPHKLSREQLAQRWPAAHASGRLAVEFAQRLAPIQIALDRFQDSPACDWPSGELVADRYRIEQLLGRGGMGNVYLAFDEFLEKQVALKTLTVGDLQQIRQEVLLAQEVTHPAVVRVIDLTITGENAFLSMEYVRGQSLDKLLRQAGKLAPSRADRMATEICQGLQAAHDKHVLHRDLKPGNVLIDDDGHVHLADFGLACSTHDRAAAQGGTIVYMSPEQLAGEELTTASDVYSLGLLLFELYSGRRLFAQTEFSAAVSERRDLQLSELTEFYSLSPQVRDAITACLQADPHQRPSSAEDVRRMLSDEPLQLPTHSIVSHWNRSLARASFTVVALSLLVILLLADRVTLIGQVEPSDPAFLQGTAKKLLRDKGFSAPRDFATGFLSRSSTPHIAPGRIVYFYRESPLLLVPNQFFPIDYWLWQSFAMGNVSPDNPAPVTPGEVTVFLDENGGLVRLQAVPGGIPRPTFDIAAWRYTLPATCQSSSWTPAKKPAAGTSLPLAYDTLHVWTAEDSETSNTTWQLVVAEHLGQLIYLDCQVLPIPVRAGSTVGIGTELYAVLLILASCVGAWNLWRGACDQRSALKVAAAVFAIALVGHYLKAHHVATANELDILEIGLAMSLYLGFVAWIGYVAIEPFVRRYVPEAFVGWQRLLAGQFRNPIVGRDLLLGVALACFSYAATTGIFYLASGGSISIEGPNGGLVRAGTFVGVLLVWLSFSIALSMLILVSLVVARQWLPRWGASLACVLLWTIPFLLPFAPISPLNFVLALAITSLTIFVLERYGFLPIVISWAARIALLGPITASPRWYWPYAACTLLVIVGIALYGARASLRGSARGAAMTAQ